MKTERFKGSVPAQVNGRAMWLDGDIPVSQLRAALGCSGLQVRARNGVIRITLVKVKQ